jgi:hypothetical protein
MSVQPDFVERAAFRLNLAPGVLLDFLGAQAFRTVCAAVELGVFEALAPGPRSVNEVAERECQRARHRSARRAEALGYVQTRGGSAPTTRSG